MKFAIQMGLTMQLSLFQGAIYDSEQLYPHRDSYSERCTFTDIRIGTDCTYDEYDSSRYQINSFIICKVHNTHFIRFQKAFNFNNMKYSVVCRRGAKRNEEYRTLTKIIKENETEYFATV